MARTRSTFRLDSDVRGYLEDASENYEGVNMTSAIHIIIRHCMEENVLDDLLRQTSTETETKPNENTSQDQTTTAEGREVDDENPTVAGEEESSGGVRFDRMARDTEKKNAEENDAARRPDEGSSDGDGSSEESADEGPRSAAASIRQRFRS